MDETQKGQQGDITPTGKEGTTSTITFTKEQVEARERKARSDALAELGRYKKAYEDSTKQMQAIEERLSRLQEERFESELEAVKDDPDKLREIRQRQREVKERQKFETDNRRFAEKEAELSEREKRVQAIERRDLAREVADEFKVDYKLLEKFATDKESMTELAKSLSKETLQRATEPPESGKTRGLTGKLTVEQVKKMSPEELVRHSKEIAELPLTI